jgi:hypothetical protein
MTNACPIKQTKIFSHKKKSSKIQRKPWVEGGAEGLERFLLRSTLPRSRQSYKIFFLSLAGATLLSGEVVKEEGFTQREKE